ncbi:MAG: DUF5996 family protein [Chloroflexota bacterium]
MESNQSTAWPELRYKAWADTLETLHMWTQIAGKVKLELAPFLNEYWQVAFHVTARGLSSGLVPYRERALQMDFDFIDHRIYLSTSDGKVQRLALAPKSVADFYHEFMDALRQMGIEVSINTTPDEVPNPIPFDQDRTHASYDAEYAHRFWQILVQVDKIVQRFRSPFIGKSSPVNFFWGSFDLSETRFSGRPATQPRGPEFYRLSEDQQNYACGFWPGNPNAAGVKLGEPAFYAYSYPQPGGFKEAAVQPGPAHFESQLGEFILPYKDARTMESPADGILEFFQSTYDAAADLGHWDRQYLERQPPHKP